MIETLFGKILFVERHIGAFLLFYIKLHCNALLLKDVLWDAPVYCAGGGVKCWTAGLDLQSQGGAFLAIYE